MAALDGALPFTEVHEAPVGVTQDLDLDMAGAGHVPLEEHPVVAERCCGLPLGGCHRAGQVLGSFHEVHALSAAARCCLDQERITHGVFVEGVVRERKGGDSGGQRRDLGRDLVAH